MNMPFVGKVFCLAMVFTFAILVASMLSPAQVMASPLNPCSSVEIQYGDTTAQYQLTADKTASDPTRDFRFAAGQFQLIPLDYEHHRCARARHTCHYRCDDAVNPHHCFRRCMHQHDCD